MVRFNCYIFRKTSSKPRKQRVTSASEVSLHTIPVKSVVSQEGVKSIASQAMDANQNIVSPILKEKLERNLAVMRKL